MPFFPRVRGTRLEVLGETRLGAAGAVPPSLAQAVLASMVGLEAGAQERNGAGGIGGRGRQPLPGRRA